MEGLLEAARAEKVAISSPSMWPRGRGDRHALLSSLRRTPHKTVIRTRPFVLPASFAPPKERKPRDRREQRKDLRSRKAQRLGPTAAREPAPVWRLQRRDPHQGDRTTCLNSVGCHAQFDQKRARGARPRRARQGARQRGGRSTTGRRGWVGFVGRPGGPLQGGRGEREGGKITLGWGRRDARPSRSCF